MPRGNPKPVQTDEFCAHTWPRVPGFKTQTKPLTIRFTAEVVEFLNSLPDRQQFVRDAVDKAIAEERENDRP